MIRQGLTLLVLCGLMTGCGNDSSPTGPTPSPAGPSLPQVVDRAFTLALNQSASVHDGALELSFRRVVSDNRCPGDALCITGGEAVLEFDVILRDGGSTLQTKTQFSTNHPASKVRLGIYTVHLEQLMPYPFGSLPPIQPGDWRATVRIMSQLD